MDITNLPPLTGHTDETAGTNLISRYGFTCGPYIISESFDDDGNVRGLLIKPEGGQVVAEVDPLANAEANARLLASAPELFDALEKTVPFIMAHVIAAHANADRACGEYMALLDIIGTLLDNITGAKS